jgi:hypothetical protein
VSAGVEGREPLVTPLQLNEGRRRKERTVSKQGSMSVNWVTVEEIVSVSYLRGQSECTGLLEGPGTRTEDLDAEVHWNIDTPTD